MNIIKTKPNDYGVTMENLGEKIYSISSVQLERLLESKMLYLSISTHRDYSPDEPFESDSIRMVFNPKKVKGEEGEISLFLQHKTGDTVRFINIPEFNFKYRTSDIVGQSKLALLFLKTQWCVLAQAEETSYKAAYQKKKLLEFVRTLYWALDSQDIQYTKYHDSWMLYYCICNNKVVLERKQRKHNLNDIQYITQNYAVEYKTKEGVRTYLCLFETKSVGNEGFGDAIIQRDDKRLACDIVSELRDRKDKDAIDLSDYLHSVYDLEKEAYTIFCDGIGLK